MTHCAKARALLIAWWFLHISSGTYNEGTATVVGPFGNESDCHETQKFSRSTGSSFSPCWSDWKP